MAELKPIKLRLQLQLCWRLDSSVSVVRRIPGEAVGGQHNNNNSNNSNKPSKPPWQSNTDGVMKRVR
jgi:hypothetical protein